MRRLLVFLVLSCAFVSNAYAETTSATNEAEESTDAEAAPAPPKKPKKDISANMGLYLGQIAAIDSKARYLFIRPSVQMEGPRQTFYIDKSTIYRRDNKKAKLEEFHPGEKVGIRYLIHNGLYLAVGVFFIAGDTVDLSDVKLPPGYKR